MIKITAKRKTEVQVYSVIAEIRVTREKKQYRDILSAIEKGQYNSYVSKFEDNSTMVMNGLKRYLGELGLLDNLTLTADGYEVMKTGMISEKESGAYNFWIIEDAIGDIGCRILKFVRVERDNSSKRQELLEFPFLRIEGESYKTLSGDEIEIVRFFRNKDDQAFCVLQPGLSESLNIIWTMEIDGNKIIDSVVNLKMNGSPPQNFYEIETLEGSSLLSDLHEDIELEEFIHLSVNSPSDYSIEELKSLTTDLTENNFDTTKFGKFNSISVSNLPIRPRDVDTAKKWMYMVLAEKLDNTYMTLNEIIDFNQRYANEEYWFIIEDSDFIETVIEEITKEAVNLCKVGKGLGKKYWRLYAVLDLLEE